MRQTFQVGNLAMIGVSAYLFIWLVNAGLRKLGMTEFQA